MFVCSTFSLAYDAVCFSKKWLGDFPPTLVLFKEDGLENNRSWQSVTVSSRRGIPHPAATVLEI